MSAELPVDWPILLAGLLLAAGVLGAGFAERLRVPGLLLFLGLGMLIADDGLGLVRLSDPLLVQAASTVALLLILFEGGLTTKPSDLRLAAAPGMVLATLGVVVTAAITAGGAWLLLDIDVTTAMLIGAVVASTDAAAVFTVLRRSPLTRRLTSLLEVESGSNDPMAIMLTIGVLETWRADPGAGEWVVFALVQLLGGLLVGGLVGLTASWLLARITLGPQGLYPVLALASAAVAYGTAAAVGASGFLAVYVAGLLIGAHVPLHRRAIRLFHNGLGSTAEIALFLLLGMLVFPTRLPAVILPGLAVAAILTFIARPIAVTVCLVWFRYSRRDLAMVSWAGLRGAVPIVLATFPFVAGHPEGDLIFDMVFFVVLVSAAVQGSTIRPLAARLGLHEPHERMTPVAEALPIDDVTTDLVEIHVTDDLYIDGRLLVEVPLPLGLITAIIRKGRVLIPTPRTRFRTDDLVIAAVPRGQDATRRVTAWARGEDRPQVRSA